MNLKTKSILGLVLFLIALVIINPVVIINLYDNILGRILIIAILVYASIYNKTLGLLVTLLIIGCLNFNINLGFEGFENNNNKKIKVQTSETSSSKELNSEKLKEKIQEKKDELNEKGVDKESVKNSIQSLDSNTIPINKSDFKNKEHEVDASNPKGKLTENFCSSCSYVM